VIAELKGANEIQFCWPSEGRNGSWLIHSDLYKALELSLGPQLVVLKNGVEIGRFETASTLSYFENVVMGSDVTLANHPAHWKAQRATIKRPKRAQEMFSSVFNNLIKKIKEITLCDSVTSVTSSPTMGSASLLEQAARPIVVPKRVLSLKEQFG
jgi:hypothetical protein